MSDRGLKNKYLSDYENNTDFSRHIHENKRKLKNKIENLPHPKDYPSSMRDGRLFQKFATEYIKNILLNGYKYNNLSENISFNFTDYLLTFTENEHSEEQSKLFLELIAFKNKKAEPQDYMYSGDFDIVINSISGGAIKSIMKKFPSNFYEYQNNSISDNINYCIIGEIKKDFYDEIKKVEIQKQFNKYAKILELLTIKPNLNKLKKRIGIHENNDLLFAVVTEENYYNFDYMRHIKKKFKEDILSDRGYDILPKCIQILNLISHIVPVILIFIPRTLDDNLGIISSKNERKAILDLKNTLKILIDGQEEMKKKLDDHQKQIDQQKIEAEKHKMEFIQYKKEIEEKIYKLIGRKRKKSKCKKKEESENDKERKGEKDD